MTLTVQSCDLICTKSRLQQGTKIVDMYWITYIMVNIFVLFLWFHLGVFAMSPIKSPHEESSPATGPSRRRLGSNPLKKAGFYHPIA